MSDEWFDIEQDTGPVDTLLEFDQALKVHGLKVEINDDAPRAIWRFRVVENNEDDL